MTEHCWNGWEWLGKAGNGRNFLIWMEWLERAGKDWKWLEIAGKARNSWKVLEWLDMADMAGNG